MFFIKYFAHIDIFKSPISLMAIVYYYYYYYYYYTQNLQKWDTIFMVFICS